MVCGEPKRQGGGECPRATEFPAWNPLCVPSNRTRGSSPPFPAGPQCRQEGCCLPAGGQDCAASIYHRLESLPRGCLLLTHRAPCSAAVPAAGLSSTGLSRRLWEPCQRCCGIWHDLRGRMVGGVRGTSSLSIFTLYLSASTKDYGMCTHYWPGVENNTSLDSLLEGQAFPPCALRGALRARARVGGTRCAQELQGLRSFPSHASQPSAQTEA